MKVVLILVVSLFFIASLYYDYTKYPWMYDTNISLITNGKIIKYFEYTVDGSEQINIVIEYKIDDKKFILDQTTYSWWGMPKFHVNDIIKVLVDKASPKNATLNFFKIKYERLFLNFILYCSALLTIVLLYRKKIVDTELEIKDL